MMEAGGRVHPSARGGRLLYSARPTLGGSTGSGRVPSPTCMRAKEPLEHQRSTGASASDESPQPEACSPAEAAADGGHRRRALAVRRFDPRGTPTHGWPKGRSIRSTAYPTSFRPPPPLTCLGCAALFELVWASGWEEKANEHLPHLLGMPVGLPFLRFSSAPWGAPTPTGSSTRSKTTPAGRALAWIDDALNEECHSGRDGAARRRCSCRPSPSMGLTAREAQSAGATGRGSWRQRRASVETRPSTS